MSTPLLQRNESVGTRRRCRAGAPAVVVLHEDLHVPVWADARGTSTGATRCRRRACCARRDEPDDVGIEGCSAACDTPALMLGDAIPQEVESPLLVERLTTLVVAVVDAVPDVRTCLAVPQHLGARLGALATAGGAPEKRTKTR
jgi:hypothetical protein